MDAFVIALLAALLGAISGTVRTFQTHGLKLIAPTFSFGDRIIKVRLGWMASAFLGALMAWAAMVGLWAFFPEQPPDTFIEVATASIFIGYSSLYLLNARLGKELPDIDAYEFGLDVSEININNAAMMLQIIQTYKCVERVQILDTKYAGVGEVYIVVKPECEDKEAVRLDVEKFIAQYRPAFIQITVKLPDEVIIDVNLKATILDLTELDPDHYKVEIEKRVRCYIDSLQPGHWVKKSQIISKSIIDKYVKDVPGNQITASPVFDDGIEIRILPTQVARAGTITVEIQTVSPLNGH